MSPKYRLTGFALDDIPKAEPLISDYRFKPYYFIHSVRNEKLNLLAKRRLIHFLSGH